MKVTEERRKEIAEIIADADRDVERAYWRLKKITPEEREALGIVLCFDKVIRLLGKTDDEMMHVYNIVKPINI